MAAADGAALRRRLGSSASGARGAGRRRDSSPPLRGAEREVAGSVTPPPGGVPCTNNAAERAIGGSEIRRKTVRGYKSQDGMLNGFGLRWWAWSGWDGLDMSDLVAAQLRAAGWGGAASSETRPKITNRFWDGYGKSGEWRRVSGRDVSRDAGDTPAAPKPRPPPPSFPRKRE